MATPNPPSRQDKENLLVHQAGISQIKACTYFSIYGGLAGRRAADNPPVAVFDKLGHRGDRFF